jgi:hypothetical protein
MFHTSAEFFAHLPWLLFEKSRELLEEVRKKDGSS